MHRTPRDSLTVLAISLVLSAAHAAPAQEPADAVADSSGADSLATDPSDSLQTEAKSEAEIRYQQAYDAKLKSYGRVAVVEKWVRIDEILEVEDGKVSIFKGRFTRPFGLSETGDICNEASSPPLIQIPGEIQEGSEVVITCAVRGAGYRGRAAITIPFAMRAVE